MRSVYATDLSSGFLDDVHGVLSSASVRTNGAHITTVPRRHLIDPTPSPRSLPLAERKRFIDGFSNDLPPNNNIFDASWAHFDHSSLPETLSDALGQFQFQYAHSPPAAPFLQTASSASMQFSRGRFNNNLFGMVPSNTMRLLEIFPPALYTFNLSIQNLLSGRKSFFITSATSSRHISLAMYFASKAAQCTYCTLYTCHLALKHGVSKSLFSGKKRLSSKDAIISTIASNMCVYPPTLTFEDRQQVYSAFSKSQVESIVLSIAVMGLFNLCMTAFTVDLDKDIVDAVGPLASTAGWTSGNHRIVDHSAANRANRGAKPRRFETYTAPLRRARTGAGIGSPGAGAGGYRADRDDRNHHQRYQYRTGVGLNEARSDHVPSPIGNSANGLETKSPMRMKSLRAYTSIHAQTNSSKLATSKFRRIPKSWPQIGDFLVGNIGYSFPIFSHLKNKASIRTLVSILLLHLDNNYSGTKMNIEIEMKYLTAIIYSTINGNYLLTNEFKTIAATDIAPEVLASVENFAVDMNVDTSFDNQCALSPAQKKILQVAKACSLNPPVINTNMVKLMREYMSPPQIVELISWLGFVATLHRLYVFYFPNCLDRNFLHENNLDGSALNDDDGMSEMSFT